MSAASYVVTICPPPPHDTASLHHKGEAFPLFTLHPLLTTTHCVSCAACVCRLKEQKGGFMNSDIKVRGMAPGSAY
jgi:hypothetical protein